MLRPPLRPLAVHPTFVPGVPSLPQVPPDAPEFVQFCEPLLGVPFQQMSKPTKPVGFATPLPISWIFVIVGLGPLGLNRFVMLQVPLYTSLLPSFSEIENLLAELQPPVMSDQVQLAVELSDHVTTTFNPTMFVAFASKLAMPYVPIVPATSLGVVIDEP